jgi:hypothetical protein
VVNNTPRGHSSLLGAKFTPVANLTSIGKLMLLNTGLCRRGLVVSSPPATEVTRAMGREIESRQGIGW